MDDADRRLNIHFTPELMAGVYANFANISHSDYEFTVTFVKVDHEVDDDEVPGWVVARVNVAPRFMRELIDAMQDNYEKWSARERIRELPETTERSASTSTELPPLDTASDDDEQEDEGAEPPAA